jgi:hypothetical protein
MKVEFVTTFDDYAAASGRVRAHWRVMEAASTFTIFAGLLLVTLAWLYLAWTVSPLWYAGAGLIVVFCARTYWTFFRRTPARLRKTFDANPSLGLPQAVEIGDDLIRHEGARGFTEYRWVALRRVHVVGGCVVLDLDRAGAIVIPRSAFESEPDFTAFCEAARSASGA